MAIRPDDRRRDPAFLLTGLARQRSLKRLVPGCLMCRVLVSLLLFALVACSIATDDQTDDLTFAQFDARLRAMTGASERQLLGAMGRIPDNSYQIGDGTKVLQWYWWDTSYDSPRCAPRKYTTTLQDGCRVEWTVSKNTSQWYHWEGHGCRSDTVNFSLQ
ncbi:MAG TPA: hypothetical protein VE963_05215 [Reyranella sp.]|nr:hypothetical protein [Reyranella sp.]